MFLGQKLFIRPLAGLNITMKEHVLKIKGKRYQFFRIGNGKKRIVLLHSLAADKSCMAEFCKPLTKKFTCLIPDLPGHNGVGMEGIADLDSYAEYIKDLVERLGWKRFGVVGFSFGGTVGQRLARIYNDEKKKVPLVMWASPLKKGVSYIPLPFKAFIFMCGLLPNWIYRWITSNRVVIWLAGIIGVRLEKDGWDAASRFGNSTIKVAGRCVIEGSDLDESIRKLIVLGKNDILVRPDPRFRESNPGIENTTFRIVENGGHFGTKAGQGEAIREIIEFLRFAEF